MITNGNGEQGDNTPTPDESNVNIGNLFGNGAGITPAQTIPNSNTPPATEVIPPTTEGQQQAPTVVIPTTEIIAPVVIENPESFEEIVQVLTSSSDHPLKAEVFNLFKATKVDEQGNLVNAEGKTVLSSAKFKDFVDNDTLPLNERGDIINELGEILKTKEDAQLESSLIIPVKEAVETNFGIKLSEGVDFPDTVEGVINLVQESVKQLNVGAVKNYLESNPEVKGFAQHLALGGTVDNYTSSNVDYKNINIKELDETSKIEYLKRSFGLQGNPNSDTLINLIKQAGEEELNKQVGSALVYLDGKQKETNKLRDQQVQQQIQQEREETKQYWTNVEKVVGAGNLNLINIPVKERQAFFDYMAKPINDKHESAELIDMQKDSLEFDLLVSYLRYKKGDISQLINNLSKTNRVQSLSDKLRKYNTITNGSGVPITTNSTKQGDSNLSIGALLGGNQNK